jgi:DNA-binding beta-propeller fold protein YncE
VPSPRFPLVAALLSLPAGLALQAPEKPAAPAPIRLGSGRHTYEWVRGWGTLPEGKSYGNTHGAIVIDSRGRIYVNTDSEDAVIVFEPDGTFVKSWGKEFRGGLHGMALVKEGEQEFLYLAHTSRHEVLKTTLDGEVLWTLGYPESAGIYGSAGEFHPTSVAVAPNGELFVADGYGRSWVHQYDAHQKYLRSFGGPGTEPGKMQTPHGLWLDTRGAAPVLYVADRENHRLQVFDLEGKLLRVVDADLRRPCNLHQLGTDLVVADLEGRVTILDKEDHLVVHLGDNPRPELRAQNGVPREQWVDGQFISPHAARWDAQGNLYVMDWLSQGRLSKLKRFPRGRTPHRGGRRWTI